MFSYLRSKKPDPPPDKTKQWTTALDGVSKLRLDEVPTPKPGKDEVLVKVLAVSLNFRDNEVIAGEYNHHAATLDSERYVPCSDMCGVVVASNASLAVGTRVLSIFNQAHLSGALRESDMASCIGYPLPGVLTTYRVFPASALVPCPEYLTPAEGACLPIAAVTAWTSLNWMRPLGSHIGTLSPTEAAGNTVLLQGTGGVSIAGLQIAHAAGMRTIITSSSDDKLKRAKELSADVGINYKTFWEWQEPVMEATGGKGADIVFETGGTRTIRKSFECVAFGGVINCIGYVSGKNDEDDGGKGKEQPLTKLNVNVLALRRNCTLRGIINGSKDRFEEMLGFFEKKKIKPIVDKEYTFEEAKEALQYLSEGKHFGKVVIKVAD